MQAKSSMKYCPAREVAILSIVAPKAIQVQKGPQMTISLGQTDDIEHSVHFKVTRFASADAELQGCKKKKAYFDLLFLSLIEH